MVKLSLFHSLPLSLCVSLGGGRRGRLEGAINRLVCIQFAYTDLTDFASRLCCFVSHSTHNSAWFSCWFFSKYPQQYPRTRAPYPYPYLVHLDTNCCAFSVCLMNLPVVCKWKGAKDIEEARSDVHRQACACYMFIKTSPRTHSLY